MRIMPFLVVPFFAFLTACEQTGIMKPQLVASPDKVSMMLADAADRTSDALEALAAIEQSRTPGIAVPPIANAPKELSRAVTIQWTGPAEPLLRQLAGRAGYGFMAFGNQPSVPPIVNIDAENRRTVEILRDVGLQLGTRADVKVDAAKKMVELHYAPNRGAGG